MFVVVFLLRLVVIESGPFNVRLLLVDGDPSLFGFGVTTSLSRASSLALLSSSSKVSVQPTSLAFSSFRRPATN